MHIGKVAKVLAKKKVIYVIGVIGVIVLFFIFYFYFHV